MKKLSYLKRLIISILVFGNMSFSTDKILDENTNNDFKKVSFILKVYNSKGNIIDSIQEGNLNVTSPPNCTIYIPGALIAFKEGIIKLKEGVEDQYEPLIKYIPNYHPAGRDILKQDINPKTWITYSCPWYGSEIFNKIGKEKVKENFENLNYGNADLSSWTDEKSPQFFWIAGSLNISPKQKFNFLENFALNKLPSFDKKVIDQTLKLIFIEELIPNWNFYGKTGAQSKRNSDGEQDPKLKSGWFDGILRNKITGMTIIAVRYIEDSIEGENYPSVDARNEMKEIFKTLVNSHQEWS